MIGMNYKLIFVLLFFIAPSFALAADAVPVAVEAEQVVLRFEITQYVVEGATLLTKAEINAAVKPYVGKNKDFSDVQGALEAVEEAYAKRGFTAVSVLLPEQELEKGTVTFRALESRFGAVTVKGNNFVSAENALNAVPSVHSGGVPRSKQIARELKLANENPSRQMNVVLKAGEKDNEVDAKVVVTDSKPSNWRVSLDNTGSPETGRSRLGLSYRHANVFNADHVANIQYVTSPRYPDRFKVLGGGYKIPLYQAGGSLEFFGAYSNVNAVIGGLTDFQGGGRLLSARYNQNFGRLGAFDPRLSLGLDWRNFKRIELGNSPPIVLYDEIVVLPVSVTYAISGKFSRNDISLGVSLAANVPKLRKGRAADFAAYDKVNLTQPEPNYKVLRGSASYNQLIGYDWQFRTTLAAQRSKDVLVQGEQMRLGGADAVRGFLEGSESGENAVIWKAEGYTPDFGGDKIQARILVFFDAGHARPALNYKVTIFSAGIGLRMNDDEQFSVRLDVAEILNDGNDPEQRIGKQRMHLSLNASF